MRQLESISRLIASFKGLPGVGLKAAERYAYAIVNMEEARAIDFCKNIQAVKDTVKYCNTCFNFSENDRCGICENRKSDTIVVVAYPKDVFSLEKAKSGSLYHILGGVISPLDGKGPNDIKIKQLLTRLDGTIKEVIIATNPDVEGDATAMYIARLISPLGIRVTRIASGVQMGSDIEYADEVTLSRAIEGRVVIK